MNKKKLFDICRHYILTGLLIAAFIPLTHAQNAPSYKKHQTSEEELLPELAGLLKGKTQSTKKHNASTKPIQPPLTPKTPPAVAKSATIDSSLPVKPSTPPLENLAGSQSKTEQKKAEPQRSPLPENLSAPEHAKTISVPLPPLPQGPFSQRSGSSTEKPTASSTYSKPSYDISDVPMTSSVSKSPSWIIQNRTKLGLHHPVAIKALQMLGVPYQWGGVDEDKGVDCSGFVIVAYEEAGLDLPRTAAQIAQSLKPLPKEKLTPGDLVFFNTRGFRYSHVGVYLGQNLFAHAPRRGAVARIDDLSDRYWSARFNGARKTPDPKI